MSDSQKLAERSNFLIENGRFMTLATQDPEGAWASTVNYVPLREPLRLLWYSLRRARHSQNIHARPMVSGSIFMTGLPGFGLDGAQFTGTASPVTGEDLEEVAEFYYQRNFPDEQTRQEWRLPLTEFEGEGDRRFYFVEIRSWWLLDIDQWLVDMNDQRIAVPLAPLARA
ncbi:pyridoxamine 5'-phosphate oxidase family protein [Nocardiopsis sp. NPDC101807]|uniref:pyridoxamine 5'-phosphate oxidase family protein n=1 Tax=Nocardiopsis sp. NPDC101807 TaxID=3364339 RepID=UPI003829E08C